MNVFKTLKLLTLCLFLLFGLVGKSQDLGLCCDCLAVDSPANCQTECGNLPTPTYSYSDCPINKDLYWLVSVAVLLGAFTIARKNLL